MVFPSRKPVHARHRHGAHRRHDHRKTRRQWRDGGDQALRAGLIGLLLSLLCLPALAKPLRVALYNADLSAPGPGLLVQALQGEDSPQHAAVIAVIAALDADVLLLTGIDYDLRQVALSTLAARLDRAGAAYPYQVALRPNTGVATGLDVDGNGRFGEPRDAMGYGRFAGEGGMAVLSRLPILTEDLRDFSAFLWADLPDNVMPDRPPDLRRVQRLSTTGHWEVPLSLPDGRVLRLLAYYASPPVFDGPDDWNGRRNHDETAFWLRLLQGELPFAPPEPPFVVLGQPNLDPADGEGRKAALLALMHHSALQDAAPRAPPWRHEPGQRGDPALDTALYPGLGGLRVEQILPSADLRLAGAGVLWPPDGDPLAATLASAARHRPIWVDLDMPP